MEVPLIDLYPFLQASLALFQDILMSIAFKDKVGFWHIIK